MSARRTIRVVMFFAAVYAFGAAFPAAAQQHKPAAKVKTFAQPVLPVLCGGAKEVQVVVDVNADTATMQLELCAPGNEKTSSATLSGGDFTSRTTRLAMGAGILFTPPRETTAKSLVTIAPIDPGSVLLVKVDLSKMWEAGEAEAPLRINGVPAAKLVAVKYRLPFGVKVDSTDPDKPELILQKGATYRVVLKNEDAVTYRVHWSMDVAGANWKDSVVITPRSNAAFALPAQESLFPWRWTGLLKDRDEDGKLTLSFSPMGAAGAPYWPSKVVPVKVHLRGASEAQRSWAVNTVLLLVLLFGAMFSYLSAVGLPNRLKRSEYREALAQLGQRITDISTLVDSRLRVMTRVQRKRLDALLGLRWAYSPDLTRIFGQVAPGLAALEKQVTLAKRIDVAHRRLQYLDTKNAPPSLLAAAEEAVWKAAEEISQLSPDDARLARSAEYLDTAFRLMAEADAEKLDAAKIKELAQGLNPKYDQTTADLKSYDQADVYTKTIEPALAGIFTPVAASEFETESIGKAARLDQIIVKRDLVRQFLQVYTASPEDFRTKLDAQLKRLLLALGLDSYKALRRARLLVRETREGVFPEDLAKVGPDDAWIEIDPASPRANNPARFVIRFKDPAMNNAAATDECEGRWDFGHDGYEESGWSPVHYFPKSGTFNLSFRFRVPDGKEDIVIRRSLDVGQEETSYWWRRDRDRAEIARLIVTLLPAAFGLLAGAKEQFLKMDEVSAFLTVFLLGFSSDTIKNLVSQSQQSPAATPAAAAAAAAAPAAAAGPAAAALARRGA